MTHAAAASNSVDRRKVEEQSPPIATRYSSVAIVLHWLIALLVLSTIPLGLYGASSQSPAPKMTTEGQAGTATPPVPPPPKTVAQQSATNVHKTVGIVILFLTVLRIAWRLKHKPPALPETMARPLRWLARASHTIFYVLLVAMPLSGWWMSSAVPNPKRHAFGFGIFDIPFLPVPQGWAWAGSAKFVHVNLAWLMIGLVVLHICAALKHHFADKDDVLKRMLPERF